MAVTSDSDIISVIIQRPQRVLTEAAIGSKNGSIN